VVTPTRDELYAKALEIFMEEMYAKGMRDVPTPEYEELKEANYIERARIELMKSPELRAWEEQLKSLELAIRQLEEAREKGIAGVPAGVEVDPETIRKFIEIYHDLKMREDQLRDLRRKRKEAVKAAEELKRQLEKAREEARKKPALKIRILQNFKEGIQYFKRGDVIETHNIDWALAKIEQGLAERVGVEVPVKILPEAPPKPAVKPPTPPPTPKERMRFLTDVFKAVLSRNNVPVKSEYLSRWRLELPSILQLPLEQQEGAAEKFAMEIVNEHRAKVSLLRRVREKKPTAPVKEIPPEWKKVKEGWITPNGVFIPEEKAVEEVVKEVVPPAPPLKPPAAALWRWLFDTMYKDVWRRVEGGWVTPKGLFVPYGRERAAVERIFRSLPAEEQREILERFRSYFPEVPRMSQAEWLKEVKGIEWDEYVRMSDMEKAELLDEYMRYRRGE